MNSEQEYRTKIVNTFNDLVEEFGLPNITIAKISETANIAKKTIYKFYNNKEDIFLEALNVFMEEHQNSIIILMKSDISSIKCLEKMIKMDVDIITLSTPENIALLKSSYPLVWAEYTNYVHQDMMNNYTLVIEQCKLNGLIKMEFSSGLIARIVVSNILFTMDNASSELYRLINPTIDYTFICEAIQSFYTSKGLELIANRLSST